MIGLTISHYKILEKIGSGGMGTVYKALDTKLDRLVALKFLPVHLSQAEEEKKRFIHEAKAASALDHPNICSIYEINETEPAPGEPGGQMFIVMACYEGESLKEKIAQGPLTIEKALDITGQIAQGLAKAHDRGIIHRDVKPANIFITTDGMVKILDFGLAKLVGQTRLTKTGSTLGTVAYMSPEQTRGSEVDVHTDIWALGVILYEMLTGKQPFSGDYEQAVIYSIINEDPKPLSELSSDIPGALEQIVNRALEKDVDKRYQQITELLDDLGSFSAGIVPEAIQARMRKEKLRKRKRAILYAGAVGLIIILAILGFTLLKGSPVTIDSIAVLPLVNLSDDKEQEYFADGMTEELITNLAKISALKVISRTSVMQYKGTRKSLPQIAKELNVDALIEGSVLREGGQVRISAQLIQAATDQHIWAESYQRDLRNVLALQGEIARAIAENIKVKLTAQEETRLAGARQVNPEAYDAYLKGSYQWMNFVTSGDLDIAEKYFDRALEKDPSYAPAYAGRAWVWIIRNQWGFVSPEEAGAKAKAAALRAIELDENSASAHAALASVRKLIDWDWDGAWESFRRTMELNPNVASAQGSYALFLMIMGHGEEALIHSERAVGLDPFNPMIHCWHAFVLYSRRRYDEAIAAAREALRIQPDFPVAMSILWSFYEKKGMEREAFEAARVSVRDYNDPRIEAALDEGYAQGGYAEAMKRGAEALIARLPEAFCLPSDIASFYISTGQKDKAIEWLEKGLEINDPNLQYLGLPYWVDLLGDEPRYQELLRKIGLPVEE